ncbi:hypothetical protein BXZ70DRAFT_486088 [Cristinia sonorae]|uniref:Uncharacterized protein n=1 Tax=Cristinia sonorae TaxID=1940300 RepID=A0A8K0XLP1_9AGAR|nr:hypothetical protein BXZ70DRAFT_486088 [Cristinia sonorae]
MTQIPVSVFVIVFALLSTFIVFSQSVVVFSVSIAFIIAVYSSLVSLRSEFVLWYYCRPPKAETTCLSTRPCLRLNCLPLTLPCVLRFFCTSTVLPLLLNPTLSHLENI